MERGIEISFDAEALEWDYKTVGVGSTGFNEHQRDVKETYGNQLFNGRMEVRKPNGEVVTYEDGCHLVERPDAAGVIYAMSKAEYAKFTGRPGSENES